jgi:hypothetical protein
MVAIEVVAVRVLAGIEQEADNRLLSVLRSEQERVVARIGARGRKQTGGLLEATRPGGGQINACPALCQNLGGIARAAGQRDEERLSPFLVPRPSMAAPKSSSDATIGTWNPASGG